jgi:hypothetical protein
MINLRKLKMEHELAKLEADVVHCQAMCDAYEEEGNERICVQMRKKISVLNKRKEGITQRIESMSE